MEMYSLMEGTNIKQIITHIFNFNKGPKKR